jgi:hypothetical protein
LPGSQNSLNPDERQHFFYSLQFWLASQQFFLPEGKCGHIACVKVYQINFNMKYYALPFIFLFISIGAFADCTNAYSSASYALSHSKKALSADNFDHQRYYAERALEAFEKTQALTENCGCDTTTDPIYQGMGNLEKAIDPKDWEMGRYYTKKAVADAQNLIAALDRCTSGAETATPPEEYTVAEESQVEIKNPEELEAQRNLKRMAELTLFEFEKSLKELASLLGCTVPNLVGTMEKRADSAFEGESLEETREYYRKQSILIQDKALQAFAKCQGSVAGEVVLQGKNP